jgi:hypothetical protein
LFRPAVLPCWPDHTAKIYFHIIIISLNTSFHRKADLDPNPCFADMIAYTVHLNGHSIHVFNEYCPNWPSVSLIHSIFLLPPSLLALQLSWSCVSMAIDKNKRGTLKGFILVLCVVDVPINSGWWFKFYTNRHIVDLQAVDLMHFLSSSQNLKLLYISLWCKCREEQM